MRVSNSLSLHEKSPSETSATDSVSAGTVEASKPAFQSSKSPMQKKGSILDLQPGGSFTMMHFNFLLKLRVHFSVNHA